MARVKFVSGLAGVWMGREVEGQHGEASRGTVMPQNQKKPGIKQQKTGAHKTQPGRSILVVFFNQHKGDVLPGKQSQAGLAPSRVLGPHSCGSSTRRIINHAPKLPTICGHFIGFFQTFIVKWGSEFEEDFCTVQAWLAHLQQTRFSIIYLTGAFIKRLMLLFSKCING